MRIAIPTEDKSMSSGICPSFGRTPYFLIFNTDTGECTFILNKAADSQGGAGIKAAQSVVDSGAQVLITQRCGQNAAVVLSGAGVELYKSVIGTAEQNIGAFIDRKLSVLTDIHPGFHGHG